MIRRHPNDQTPGFKFSPDANPRCHWNAGFRHAQLGAIDNGAFPIAGMEHAVLCTNIYMAHPWSYEQLYGPEAAH